MLNELVRPLTVKEALVDTLRDVILRGELKWGEPLREEGLSKSLKVARGTLREAFRVLQEEGLVEAYPHRGVFVTTLSTRKVREVYTLRELLEPYAVGLAMENDAYGEQELQEIEALLRRLGELEQEGNAFGRAEAIAEFHYLICKPSDHHWLLDVLKSLRSFERLCIVNIILYDIEELSAEYQHRQIFDAIRAGDPAQAQAVLREHLIFSRNSTLVAMTAAEADSQ